MADKIFSGESSKTKAACTKWREKV